MQARKDSERKIMMQTVKSFSIDELEKNLHIKPLRYMNNFYDLNYIISTTLVNTMQARQWDENQLAEYLQLSPKRISKLLEGDCDMKLSTLCYIADKLGLSIELKEN